MSLENILKYLDLFAVIFPILEKLVDFVENIFQRFGLMKSGEQKKAAVEKMAKVILRGKDIEMPEGTLSDFIDSIVDTKNTSGQFIHSEGSPELRAENN